MIISREGEKTFCLHCRKDFNLENRKPQCYMPCGHTFCEKCIEVQKKPTCYKCKMIFNQSIPDYGMIDILVEKLKQKEKKKVVVSSSEKEDLVRECLIALNEGYDKVSAVQKLRKLLSGPSPPIQETIDIGFIGRLVGFLTSSNSTLKFETCWVLTNIASGNKWQTDSVIKAGAVPLFVELVTSKDISLSEQAIWALSNIAGDSNENRDLLIESDAIPKLINATNYFVRTESDKSKLKRFEANAAWALQNFCRGKPKIKIDKIEPILGKLSHYIYHEDHEILSDTCWALSFLTDGDDAYINAVIKNFKLSRFTELAMNNNERIAKPSLRIIGNVITGNDEMTQKMLDCGVLPALVQLIKSEQKKIRKEVCWTASNIAAGNQDQIKQLIDSGIMPSIKDCLENDEFEVKKEVAWTFANLLEGGSLAQKKIVFDMNIFDSLCTFLFKCEDNLMLQLLGSLDRLLEYDATHNSGQLAYSLKRNSYNEDGSYYKIEGLSESKNGEVYEIVREIMNKINRVNDDDDIDD